MEPIADTFWPLPADSAGWDAWDLARLRQYIGWALTAEDNEDRPVPELTGALNLAAVALFNEAYPLGSKDRRLKVVMVENTARSIPPAAAFTLDFLGTLLSAIKAVPKSAADLAVQALSDAGAGVREALAKTYAAAASAWTALYDEATATWAGWVQSEPKQAEGYVTAFLTTLNAARVDLDAIAQLLASGAAPAGDPAWANQQALEQRFADISLGFWRDAEEERMGAVPALVVGAVVVGIAAACWAVVGYQYAVNLREQTALQRADLAARVSLAQQGLTLPASTLPAGPKDPLASLSDAVTWLVGGGVAIAALNALGSARSLHIPGVRR